MIELAHGDKKTKFDPDKWHPYRKSIGNLAPSEQRHLMRKQMGKMPKTWDEFKRQEMRRGR